MYSNFKSFLVVAAALCFVACSDFPRNVPQPVSNNSDYDVVLFLQGNYYVVPAGAQANIPCKINSLDAEYEQIVLTDRGYPRATMTGHALMHWVCSYTIENAMAEEYTVTNTSEYSVYVTHPYKGKEAEYEDTPANTKLKGFFVRGYETVSVSIYEVMSSSAGFNATYRMETDNPPVQEEGESAVAFEARKNKYNIEKNVLAGAKATLVIDKAQKKVLIK